MRVWPLAIGLQEQVANHHERLGSKALVASVMEKVPLTTLEWVSWFNHQRLLEPIGYIPPAEAEANYYRQLASHATTAVA